MADEIIRLDYSAEDIGDNIDEVRTARGTFDTLDDRLDNIEGGGPSPSNPIASNCVSPMTGYSKSSSSTPGNISTSDTLNAAIGKLEKRTEINENNISLITPFDTAPTPNSEKGMSSGALFTEFGKTLRKLSTLSANDDFNSATSSGIHKFNGGPANNPAGSNNAYGILLVITFDNYTMHLCYDFLTGVYCRNKVSSWSAWTKFN